MAFIERCEELPPSVIGSEDFLKILQAMRALIGMDFIRRLLQQVEDEYDQCDAV